MAADEPDSGTGDEADSGVAAAVRPLLDPRLTARQRKVLRVIREWVEEHGYPPSVREIGDAVGLQSTSSVHHQLRTLERKGYLRRDPNRTRAVDVRLPEENAAAAWASLARLEREQKLLEKDLVAVDLRYPDRLVVRLTPDAAARRRLPAKST